MPSITAISKPGTLGGRITISGTSFVDPVIVTIDGEEEDCEKYNNNEIVCTVGSGTGRSHSVSLVCGIYECGLHTQSSWSYHTKFFSFLLSFSVFFFL